MGEREERRGEEIQVLNRQNDLYLSLSLLIL